MEEGVEMSSSDSSFWAPKKIVTLVVVGVVLVALAYLLGFVGGERGETTIERVGPGQELTTPPQGQLVENFPNELLLEEGIALQDSYSIDYQYFDVEQPVVRYTSELDFTENVALFSDFFAANGWDVGKEADPAAESVTSFYAKKGGDEVNVTFILESGGVVVNISYIFSSEPSDSTEELDKAE